MGSEESGWGGGGSGIDPLDIQTNFEVKLRVRVESSK